MPTGNAPPQFNPVKLVAANGYSRSDAGLPWDDKTTSIHKTSTMTGGRMGTPSKDAFRESLSSGPSWGALLFRSTYTQSYATHNRDQARLLNHERLMLHGGGGGSAEAASSLRFQLGGASATSLDNSLVRRPTQPFGGVSSAVWRR